jgi:hypothetical protein
LEAEIGRIKVQGQPREIVPETPISKITRTKWTGGVAKVVEHLLCKLEALSSKSQFYHPQKNRIRGVSGTAWSEVEERKYSGSRDQEGKRYSSLLRYRGIKQPLTKKKRGGIGSQAWWYTPIIPALGRMR